MKALIVHESHTERASLVRIIMALAPNSLTVEVEYGRDGLKAMTQTAFDIIITDLDMGGADFIKHLMDSRLLRTKPIIIYSSLPYDEPTPDNVVVVNKSMTSMYELSNIVKELIFKYRVCPRCPEAINFTTCNDICFYHTLDLKWKDKIRDYLK